MKRNLKIGPIIFFVLLFVASLFCGKVLAASVIVAANDRGNEYAKAIASKIPGSIVVTPQEKPKLVSATFIITVGNEPFVSLVGNIDVPIVASFVSYNTYYSIPESHRSNTHAIFIEPNPHQIASRLQQLFGGRPKVGYIYGSNDHYYEKLLEQKEIALVGIPLVKSVLKTLNVFYTSTTVDGFYISENRDIYNNSNILLVLESVYRNRIPTITSNPSLVGRGSVLSLLVTYDQLILKTVEVAARMQGSMDVSAENFGELDIDIDIRLARKLNLSLSGVTW